MLQLKLTFLASSDLLQQSDRHTEVEEGGKGLERKKSIWDLVVNIR